jgi:hypothetical protein
LGYGHLAQIVAGPPAGSVNPVLNREHGMTIARDWNVKHSGSGYVTRFRVRRPFLNRCETHQVGGRTIV